MLIGFHSIPWAGVDSFLFETRISDLKRKTILAFVMYVTKMYNVYTTSQISVKYHL